MVRTSKINSIRLENFKAFRDTGTIILKPITLLVGKNSAGKSSFIKAILAASQTVSQEQADNSDFRLIGDLTNLGTYSDTIHGNDITTNFSMHFGVSNHVDKWCLTHSFSHSEENPLGASIFGVKGVINDQLFFSAKKPLKGNYSIQHRGKALGNLVISRAYTPTQSLPADEDITSLALNNVLLELIEKSQQYMNEKMKSPFVNHEEEKLRAFSSNLQTSISKCIPMKMNGRNGFMATSLTGEQYEYEIGSLDHASSTLRRSLARIIYLAPLRDEPMRGARLAQSSGNRIGIKGEDLATMLHVRSSKDDFMEKFNTNLKNLGVADSATTRAIYMKDEAGNELETGFIKILLKHEGTTRSLMDLGFGTSQVLPIVFELSLRRDRIILLEQPELHLHPAAQAEIGDLLKFSIEQNNQLIVETHSANLIERLRRLIRTKELTKDDVNIVYIRKDSEGNSRCDTINFNDDGTFADTWPEDDFFGEREKEIFADW
jgi:predicted ATPase